MSEVKPALPRVSELSVVSHATYVDDRGALCPIELEQVVGFPVVRMFWVSRVPDGQERGGHAHKKCSQYLICLEGSVEVSVSDGTETAEIRLDQGQALLVQPGLWASERYSKGALLLVLCDQLYDTKDYIVDLDAFLTYRRERAA